MKNIFQGHAVLDRVGIVVSSLCMVHCLLLPVLILSLPIMARYYLAHPWFHAVISLMVIPVGLVAFVRGFRHHHKLRVLVLGLPGLALVAIGPLLIHTVFTQLNEPLLLSIGSILLISAHMMNKKVCKTCPH